jgi:hypothetical protein
MTNILFMECCYCDKNGLAKHIIYYYLYFLSIFLVSVHLRLLPAHPQDTPMVTAKKEDIF